MRIALEAKRQLGLPVDESDYADLQTKETKLREVTNMENYVKNLASSYGRDSDAMMDEMLKLNGCNNVDELQAKVARGESIIEAADTSWNAGIQKQHYAGYDAMIAARNAEASLMNLNASLRGAELGTHGDTRAIYTRQWYDSQKGPLDRFAEGLNSWAADVSKGPQEFIGNNRGAGLAACFGGAIIGPALSLGLGKAIATAGIWAPAVFGGSKTAVAVNTTVGAINSAGYYATSDDPTLAGMGMSFAQGYGMSRIGAAIGSAAWVTGAAKYAAGGGAGLLTDLVFQSAKINMGMQADYSASQLAGSTLFGGLSVLPHQSFKPVGQIGADFWPHYYPAVNTAKYTTLLTGWMSWMEDDYRKNKNRNR